MSETPPGSLPGSKVPISSQVVILRERSESKDLFADFTEKSTEICVDPSTRLRLGRDDTLGWNSPRNRYLYVFTDKPDRRSRWAFSVSFFIGLFAAVPFWGVLWQEGQGKHKMLCSDKKVLIF